MIKHLQEVVIHVSYLLFTLRGPHFCFHRVSTGIVDTTRQLLFPVDHPLYREEEVIFILTV